MLIDEKLKQSIMDGAFKNQFLIPKHKEIRETELLCFCGGTLIECRTEIDIELPEPKTHKKSRINKKWAKKYRQDNLHLILTYNILNVSRPPFYKCKSCGSQSGFHAAMARNMFTVQKLPEGTKQIYNQEP